MKGRRATLALLVGAATLAGCFEERPRPGPPRITFSLDKTQVRSSTAAPDTLAGTVRVADTDGIDSLWVTVDGAVSGVDGLFHQAFNSRFRFAIGAGIGAGTHLDVEFRARDIGGFETMRDTFVVVVP